MFCIVVINGIVVIKKLDMRSTRVHNYNVQYSYSLSIRRGESGRRCSAESRASRHRHCSLHQPASQLVSLSVSLVPFSLACPFLLPLPSPSPYSLPHYSPFLCQLISCFCSPTHSFIATLSSFRGGALAGCGQALLSFSSSHTRTHTLLPHTAPHHHL